ncbi:hypothetical protein JR316_0003727 [Psilocybe cubensis]|uniref:Uncharacterized protein n=2 Tax=Psilocybe cubensis TaxID=181762 RepID=A0ACB8H9B4_PSICU|nr:hypothetical protein JR316_0003727 [Psilocybe cubensis]KAH9484247.1 hypothetical protein JR316_0003727 [Psilocybe cubensis]
MLGIEDYGSDSDTAPDTTNAPSTSASAPKTAPKPTVKPQRPPKKITIALPTMSASKDDDAKESEDNDRPVKKRKTGAGSSSLLSMLPTPKQSNPVPQAQPRVLGGGSGKALNFNATARTSDAESTDANLEQEAYTSSRVEQPEEDTSSASVLFRPTSVAKGRKNISVEETSLAQIKFKPATSAPAVDFFSLGSSKSVNSAPQVASSSSVQTTISSAPALPTFEIPEPTPTDQYPGYYQLPSGQWAAHDPEYYDKFVKKWQKEYNDYVRALEKGTIKGFEGLQDAAVEEVDALKEMEKAKKEIQEREEKKAITQGAGGVPVAPKMNINASKTSGIARSRHQLSTLLKEAYENREALEERIAQGKRNRKEAGNKYGKYLKR